MTAPAYATDADFRDYIEDDTNLSGGKVTRALLSASREVDGYCGRKFYQASDTQYFSPDPGQLWLLRLDDMDLATTTALTVHVQFSNTANYSEARVFGTDFICQPVNQSVNGIEGWPFTSLQAINGKIWPPRYADFVQDTVKVDGTFGWPAIPDPVVEATLILALQDYKLSTAPFGVAGFGEYGATKVRNNPAAMNLLQPYRKDNSLLMA